MSNVLELTASSMASYQTSWYHTGEIIQGYYNNDTTKLYFGYCWFSSADLATLRNTINNTVQVEKVELYFQRDNSSHGTSSATAVQINNTTRTGTSGTPSTSELSNGLVIGSFTRGQAKWCTINETLLNGLLGGQNGFCFYHSSAKASGTFNYYVRSSTLPKIRITYSVRYSSISSDVDKVNFGSTVKTTITPNDETFFHILNYQVGDNSKSFTLAAGNLEHSFAAPLDWISAIPDAVIAYMTISCDTYDSGGELIGTETIQVEVDVPSTVVPNAGTLAITVNGDTTGWNVAIVDKTTITAVLSGYEGIYGSTITGYTITAGNYSSVNEDLLVESLEAGTLTITGTVTDSRGRKASVKKEITVYDYLPPFFQSLEVGRCNQLGELSSDGHYARIKGVFDFSSVGEHNTVTCSMKYTCVSTGEETSAGNLTSGVTKLIGEGNLSSDEEYDIEFTLADGLQTVTYIRHLNSSAFAIHFKNGGRGVAFGQAATEDEAVRLHKDWHFYVKDGLDLANLKPSDIGASDSTHTHSLADDSIIGMLPASKLASTNAEASAIVAVLKTAIVDSIYPVGSVYITVSSDDPNTTLGGTWERIKDQFLLSAGDTYSAGSTGGAASASHKHGTPLGYGGNAVGFLNINGTYSGGKGKAYRTANVDNSGSSVSANVTLGYTANASVSTLPPYLVVNVWKRTA